MSKTSLGKILSGNGSKGQDLLLPDDELDDALIQEYLSELEEMEWEEARQETQQSTLAVPTGIIGID